MRVIVLDAVKEDLRETNAYLKKRFGDKIAKKCYQEARTVIQSLGANLNIGTIIPELEEIQLSSFKQHIPNGSYRILYEVKQNEIVVHACCSTRRDYQTLLFKRLMKA